MAKQARRNKYGAKRSVVHGITFASKLEAARYIELYERKRAGVIFDLECQVRFDVTWPGSGEKFYTYVADFAYYDRDGNYVVEDVKGRILDTFRLKIKGVRFQHGVSVAVVTRKRVGKKPVWHFNGVPEETEWADWPEKL